MYDQSGKRLGATILSVPVMTVTSTRTPEKNGYSAALVKFDSKTREIRTTPEELASIEPNQTLAWAEMFKAGDKVKVTGTSKGHGFTGVVRRYHFKGGPRTHGQSNRERSRGSSGPTTTPGRVLPGKRMSGRMGNITVSIKNMLVVEVNPEKNLLILSGSVPGPKTGWVRITK